MERLEVKFSKDASKQYKKLPKEYKTLVDIALYRLSETLELDLKSIEGERDVYRVRIGKYRVLLRKFDRTVLVFRISTRGGAYK
ncbi:MAG: type II toxin-antitoxin system RelE/ParE family toxin [Dehalococcoidia bacterium]|nr:type II toxin-antitoxin system RelE/ParE family toxin [Dehalococcoidia bacterium]